MAFWDQGEGVVGVDQWIGCLKAVWKLSFKMTESLQLPMCLETCKNGMVGQIYRFWPKSRPARIFKGGVSKSRGRRRPRLAPSLPRPFVPLSSSLQQSTTPLIVNQTSPPDRCGQLRNLFVLYQQISQELSLLFLQDDGR